MGLCILLLEPHVGGSHKTPAQTKGMAANLPQRDCHGEASKGKGEPIYSPKSNVHSWGVSEVGRALSTSDTLFSQFKLHSQSCTDQNVCTSDMNMLVFSNLHQMGWYHAMQSFLDNKVNCLG